MEIQQTAPLGVETALPNIEKKIMAEFEERKARLRDFVGAQPDIAIAIFENFPVVSNEPEEIRNSNIAQRANDYLRDVRDNYKGIRAAETQNQKMKIACAVIVLIEVLEEPPTDLLLKFYFASAALHECFPDYSTGK